MAVQLIVFDYQETGFYWRDAHDNRKQLIAQPYFNINNIVFSSGQFILSE